MNMQNLLAQMGKSNNPMAMLMNMLNPSQKQMVSQFQGKPDNEKAQAIADFCNQNGINKEKLQEIMSMMKR